MNLTPFGLGALLNLGLLLIEPSLYGFRALLVGFLDRLSRCEAAAFQVVAYRTYGQFYPKLLLDQLHHRGTTPQCKFHLQLLGPLVADRALNNGFLLHGQGAPVT